ncbi:hypothetical protein B0H11DRAFT_2032667, partial [Mycena galericulata]
WSRSGSIALPAPFPFISYPNPTFSLAAFMSSVDLYTHASFHPLLPASFAVVCARLSRRRIIFCVFHLTEPPAL